MKWIKASESEPKTMGYYFIKFLDSEDDEISKDVAEFIPGFAWPVPDGCEVVEWLDESQPQKEEVNEDEKYTKHFKEWRDRYFDKKIKTLEWHSKGQKKHYSTGEIESKYKKAMLISPFQ